MILADTSIWVDHLRTGDPTLRSLLMGGEVIIHPWVIGELVLGGLPAGADVHRLLSELPSATLASHVEVMGAIGSRSLAGRGIGYVDAHLVVAVMLTAGSQLWTRDMTLATVAIDLGVAMG